MSDQEDIDNRLERSLFAASGRTNNALSTKLKQPRINQFESAKYEFIIDNLKDKMDQLQTEVTTLNNRPFSELHNNIDRVLAANPEFHVNIQQFLDKIMSTEVNDAELDVSTSKKQQLSIDRWELAHSEQDVLAVLHKFKPERYVEYAQLIESNICDKKINGKPTGKDDVKKCHYVVDVPPTKYGAHLVGFRAVLRPAAFTECQFTLLNGALTVQNIKYKPTRGMITPKIYIPTIVANESDLINAQEGYTVHHPVKVTGISVNAEYVQDIIGIYRISAAIISPKFREYDFYGKYKFASDKLVRIFQHDYSELQYAAQFDLLDITQWIIGDDKHLTVNHEEVKDFDHCLETCFLIALKRGSKDVANYILERLERYRINVDRNNVITAAAQSLNYDSLNIAMKYYESHAPRDLVQFTPEVIHRMSEYVPN